MKIFFSEINISDKIAILTGLYEYYLKLAILTNCLFALLLNSKVNQTSAEDVYNLLYP